MVGVLIPIPCYDYRVHQPNETMISTNFTPSASEARSTICVLADEYSWETVAKEMIHRMTGDEAREFVEDFQTNYSN